MNKTAEWNEIMNALRALRLAVYDDLMVRNEINVADHKVQEALGWLIFHRFVVKAEGGAYIVQPIHEAGKLWREQGPAREEAGGLFCETAVQQPAAAPVPTEPEMRVPHRGSGGFQGSLFP